MTDKDPIMYLLPDSHEMTIKTGRLFFYLYNELFYSFAFKKEINTKLLLSKLKTVAPEMEVLFKYDYKVESESGFKDITGLYIIKLKERVLLEIGHNIPALIYGQNEDIKTYKEIVNSLYTHTRKPKYFNLIVSASYSDTGLDVEPFEVKEQIINISENYNDDFFRVNDNILDFLNKDNISGLILLHGKQGTGKTSYIRHLISSVNKTFIYLPSQMACELSKPHFIPFIKKFKDCILIIEDCENIIRSREVTPDSDNALANLLNLGDGLLSDALCLKIICTFNTELRNIDKAILRKGRLKGRYEFSELSIDKVDMKLKKLNVKNIKPIPMTLAEIYNISENYTEVLYDRPKIGFN